METSFEKAKRIAQEKEAAMKSAADATTETATAHSGNISEEHSLTTAQPATLARQIPGVPIGGFNELPVSMLTLPYCVITQALTDVYLSDGKTAAPKGEWYFTDTKTTRKELSFISLRAKVVEKDQVGDNGEVKKVTKLRVLCVDIESTELFIFSLPLSSFTAWGSMMAQLKKMGVKNSFEYVIKATVKQATNKKGQKYFIGDFAIADKLEKEDLEAMQEKLGEFGGVLDSAVMEEEEVA